MASACVVPWTVERDEPPPNSPPIFDLDVTDPKLGDSVPLTAQQFFQPLVAARDADLGNILTARLFAEIPSTKYYYFGVEFRLSQQTTPDPTNPLLRTGQPTSQFAYCPLLGSTTVRVVVTDGTFSNQQGEQQKATGGEVIEGNWRLVCN